MTDISNWTNYQSVYLSDGTVLRGARTNLRVSLIPWETLKEYDMSVLDLGCSNGLMSIEAKKHGLSKVVGVDNAECIKMAREWAKVEDLDIEFIQADIEGKEFQRYCQRFDVIFFFAMLNHVKDKVGMLEFIDTHTNWACFYETNYCNDPLIHLDMLTAYTSFYDFNGPFLSEIYPDSYYLFKCSRQEKTFEMLRKYGNNIKWIPCEQIFLGIEYRNKESNLNLLEHIRKNGIRIPILIRPYDKDGFPYAVVEGGRRFICLELLGLKDFPCYIQN